MKLKKTVAILFLVFAIILSNVTVFAAGTPVAAAAGIAPLTGQELVDEGLIEDINFANAIADSINADPVF